MSIASVRNRFLRPLRGLPGDLPEPPEPGPLDPEPQPEDEAPAPPRARPKRPPSPGRQGKIDPRLPPPGSELRGTYKGIERIAIVQAEGKIELDGVVYSSISAAASAACGGGTPSGYVFFGLAKKPR